VSLASDMGSGDFLVMCELCVSRVTTVAAGSLTVQKMSGVACP